MTTSEVFPTIYTLDSKGKTRTWRMELDGSRYRTVSGIEGGKEVASGWETAEPKNVGRSNATTAEVQARLEVEAEYKKKRDRKYHNDRSGGGAKFSQPMLAVKYVDRGWPGEPVWSQPKLDGIRALATPSGLFSRQGKRHFVVGHIERQLERVFAAYPWLELDGELYNHTLKDDFNKITSLVRKSKPTFEDELEAEALVQYHVYDVICHSDENYRRGFESFSERASLMDALESMFGRDLRSVKFVMTSHCPTEDRLDELYAGYLAAGYEGQMVRLDRPYERTRSKSLQKRKEFDTDEFPVVRIEEGVGNWAGAAKTVVVRLPSGVECGSGVRGTKEHLERVLSDYRSGARVPTQATVRYQGYTPNAAALRFPVIVDLHYGERDD